MDMYYQHQAQKHLTKYSSSALMKISYILWTKIKVIGYVKGNINDKEINDQGEYKKVLLDEHLAQPAQSKLKWSLSSKSMGVKSN